MRVPAIIAIILMSVSVFGQRIGVINLKETISENLEKNLVHRIDKAELYINDVTSKELFYYAIDQTAMINQLRIMGNKDANFMNALGKGYRLNGLRHPHS